MVQTPQEADQQAKHVWEKREEKDRPKTNLLVSVSTLSKKKIGRLAMAWTSPANTSFYLFSTSTFRIKMWAVS